MVYRLNNQTILLIFIVFEQELELGDGLSIVRNRVFVKFSASGLPKGSSWDNHVMVNSWKRKSVHLRISTSLRMQSSPSTDSLSSRIIQTRIHTKLKMHQHNLSSVQEVDERVWDEYRSASCREVQQHT